MFSSFKVKRKTLFLYIIVIAFLMILGHLVHTLIDLANQQVTERNLRTLDYGIRRIENHIGKIETILGTIKHDPNGTVSQEKVSGELNRLLREYPEVQNIWIASAQRRIVYATHSEIVGMDLANPEEFNMAKSERRSIISAATTIQGTGVPHISITIPLYQGTEFRGIIGANIDLSRFNEVLKDIVQHEKNMVLTILDREMTVIASSHGDVAPGTNLASFNPAVEALIGRKAVTTEYVPVFKDENLYVYSSLLNAHWVIILSQPVTDVYASWLNMMRNGIPLLLLCISLLIGLTYQVNKLENMRKIEALEFQNEKSHAVSELAASVAHEVRNPITVIRGFMQLLSMRSTDVKAHEYAQLIVEEVDRVESIIGEFLSLAKPHTIKIEKCNLHQVLHGVYILAQGRGVSNGVDVVFDVPDECMVMGDGMQLKQVFLNLCTNAIEAMPGGGTLKILAACVKDEVVVKITDNGQGIPTESLKRLGERFFTSKETGTGLGLAVSYRIVNNHQGKINVASELGKGTEFTVTLPNFVDTGQKDSETGDTVSLTQQG